VVLLTRVVTICALFGCLAPARFAQAAYSPDVQVGDLLKFSDGPGVLNGGEFFVDNRTSNGITANPGDFITFCVQTNENINFASLFRVDAISTQSVVDQNVPLASGTAYLYRRFRDGTLVMRDLALYGTGTAANHAADGDALQQAIWYLQFGRAVTGTATQILDANYLISQANTAISSGLWSGISNVRIANLSYATGSKTGNPAQDQLVLLPEPGSLIMWSLFGACVIGCRRFRRRQSDSACA